MRSLFLGVCGFGLLACGRCRVLFSVVFVLVGGLWSCLASSLCRRLWIFFLLGSSRGRSPCRIRMSWCGTLSRIFCRRRFRSSSGGVFLACPCVGGSAFFDIVCVSLIQLVVRCYFEEIIGVFFLRRARSSFMVVGSIPISWYFAVKYFSMGSVFDRFILFYIFLFLG